MVVLHTSPGHDSPTPIRNTPPQSYTIEHLYNHIIISTSSSAFLKLIIADVQIISNCKELYAIYVLFLSECSFQGYLQYTVVQY